MVVPKWQSCIIVVFKTVPREMDVLNNHDFFKLAVARGDRFSPKPLSKDIVHQNNDPYENDHYI